MCRSQAEGGQRCASHAKARLDACGTAFQYASREHWAGEGSWAEMNDAEQEWRRARIEYASTPAGRTDLEARQDACLRSGDTFTANDIALALSEGSQLRERNQHILSDLRRSAGRSALLRSARDGITATGRNRSMAYEAQVKVLHARFDGFAKQAETDPALHAPAAAKDAADAVASKAGLSSMGRVHAYALWRAQQDGATFAPPPPAGTAYTDLMTSWPDVREGDFIAEPGYALPGLVEHEGKVVASTSGSRLARQVTFTDGTSGIPGMRGVKVLRPHTREQEDALSEYSSAQAAGGSTGRDESGHWAENPTTGTRHYHP